MQLKTIDRRMFALGYAIGRFDPGGKKITDVAKGNVFDNPAATPNILRHVWQAMIDDDQVYEWIAYADPKGIQAPPSQKGSFWIGYNRAVSDARRNRSIRPGEESRRGIR